MGHRQQLHVQRNGWWPLALFAGVLVALLAAFSVLIADGEQRAREQLADRFEARAALSGSFTQEFVADLAEHEIAQAERLLAAPEVTRTEFERVVRSFGFEAAVLLDAQGSLVHVWPARPEMIGRDMTRDYEHLRTARAGRVRVSDVMPSAAERAPIVAVAVPFDSAAGRRVFSGAFAMATTPLGAYLHAAVPIRGGEAFLLDGSGAVIASHAQGELPRGIAQLSEGVANLDTPSGELTVAVADVPGLPWRVVLTAPSEDLYAPVSGGQGSSWLLFLAFAITGTVTMGLFRRLQRTQAAAEGSARTDPLTGLQNRRAMQEALDQAVALAARHGTQFAALMIDIDRFKTINDTYGHDAGDNIIRSVATALSAATRDVDRAARWGGEEFLVLLHDTDTDAAMTAAQRIRHAIAAAALPAPLTGLNVSVSIGVAGLGDHDTEQMLRQADAALYTAKANGRNRVELATTGWSRQLAVTGSR